MHANAGVAVVEQHNKFFARQEVTQLKGGGGGGCAEIRSRQERARAFKFVTIRNCLFGLIALVEAPRGAAAPEFIVSNERKSFAGGKKSYWNFSNCCWMRENRGVSLDTAELLANTAAKMSQRQKSIFLWLWRASEPLDCIYHFIQTKESVIEAIILPLCILLSLTAFASTPPIYGSEIRM